MHVQVVDEGQDALTHRQIGNRRRAVPRVVVDDRRQVAEGDEGSVELVGDLRSVAALPLGDLLIRRMRPDDSVGDVGGRAHDVTGDVARRPPRAPRRLLPLLVVERADQGAEGLVLRQQAGDRLFPSESHAAAPSI